MKKLLLSLFLITPWGCATAPPIAVNGFCELHVAKDFTDKGLKAQNDANLRADLANDNTHARDCRAHNLTVNGGPR